MPQTLAQMVRAKYPGAYDDLSDQQLEQMVRTKYPGTYDDLPSTPAKSDTAKPADNSSPVMDFAKGVASQINPIEMVKGLYGAVTHPIDTIEGLGEAQLDQLKKGKAMYDQGRYSEAFGHALAGVLPLIGPAAANVGEDIGQGNIAHGLGAATGLIGTVAAPSVVKGSAKVASALPGAEAAAGAAESGAFAKFADVMSPKVGQNKVRLGNLAQKIAPDVAATEGIGSWTKAGFADKVAAKLDDATSALDAANDARLAARPISTAPLVDALKQKLASLTAQPFEGALPERTTSTRTSALVDASGKPIEVATSKSEPIGEPVIPAPSQARAAPIQQAIKEVEALGPVASYDAIKKIRASYDGPAKLKYVPAVTPDYLAKTGQASGAADVTGVLRSTLAEADPGTAAANAKYSLWKSANDLMSAVQETERTRPTVGRQLMARMTGAIAGGAASGLPGAVGGAILGPAVDSAVRLGPTRQIMTARGLSELAQAIRTGDVSAFDAVLKRFRAVVIGANAAALSSTSGGQQ